MKRLSCVLLVGFMLIVLSSCSNSGSNEITNNDSTVPTNDTSSVTSKEDNTEKKDDELIYTFEDPAYNVVFDYPNMQVIEKNTSRVFRKTAKYIIVYCRDEGEVALSDIPNKLQEKFTYATSTYVFGDADGFNFNKQTEIDVNGTKALEVLGEVLLCDSDGNKESNSMVGYTFCKDGCSCELIGIVTDEDDGTYYKEMSDYISKMIKTLRDDR